MARNITDIIIHASATFADMDIGLEEIRDWHINPKKCKDKKRGGFYWKYKGQRFDTKEALPLAVQGRRGNGWSDVGYHYIIRRDGSVQTGRAVTKIGAHCSGHNEGSIGICLVGGLGHDENGKKTGVNNFTPEQFRTLKVYIEQYNVMFPHAKIRGHRDYPGVKKSCPCFDVREWCAENGLNSEGNESSQG